MIRLQGNSTVVVEKLLRKYFATIKLFGYGNTEYATFVWRLYVVGGLYK